MNLTYFFIIVLSISMKSERMLRGGEANKKNTQYDKKFTSFENSGMALGKGENRVSGSKLQNTYNELVQNVLLFGPVARTVKFYQKGMTNIAIGKDIVIKIFFKWAGIIAMGSPIGPLVQLILNMAFESCCDVFVKAKSLVSGADFITYYTLRCALCVAHLTLPYIVECLLVFIFLGRFVVGFEEIKEVFQIAREMKIAVANLLKTASQKLSKDVVSKVIIYMIVAYKDWKDEDLKETLSLYVYRFYFSVMGLEKLSKLPKVLQTRDIFALIEFVLNISIISLSQIYMCPPEFKSESKECPDLPMSNIFCIGILVSFIMMLPKPSLRKGINNFLFKGPCSLRYVGVKKLVNELQRDMLGSSDFKLAQLPAYIVRRYFSFTLKKMAADVGLTSALNT